MRFYLGFNETNINEIENNCKDVLSRFNLSDKEDEFDDYVLQYLEEFKITDGINAIIESFFIALKDIIIRYRNKNDEDFDIYINAELDSHFCIINKRGEYIELCNAN